MAGSEINYTFAIRGTAFYQRERANTTTLPVYRNNALVAPTAVRSTFQLVNSAGQVHHTGVVVVGVDNIPTVTVAAIDLPSTLQYGPLYQERWGLMLDGVLRFARRDVVLGKFEMHPPVAEGDLTNEYPDILTDLGEFGTDLQTFQDAAWQEVCRKIERRGDYPDIFVQSSDVYDWYRHATFERIFRALAKFQPGNERWATLWEFHRDTAKIEMEGMTFRPDRNRDGQADSNAREELSKSYHINMAPRRRLRDPRW